MGNTVRLMGPSPSLASSKKSASAKRQSSSISSNTTYPSNDDDDGAGTQRPDRQYIQPLQRISRAPSTAYTVIRSVAGLNGVGKKDMFAGCVDRMGIRSLRPPFRADLVVSASDTIAPL